MEFIIFKILNEGTGGEGGGGGGGCGYCTESAEIIYDWEFSLLLFYWKC